MSYPSLRSLLLPFAAVFLLSGASFAADDDDNKENEAVPMPAGLERIIKKLPDEKREFLMSDDAEGFTGTREKLYERLDGKSAEAVEAYVDGMMTVVESGKFNPETDMAVIQLNTEAENFNGWKVKRPKILNPEREPGPFALSYYANRRGGIRTFAGAPVAIYPEDLIAGKVDVAFANAFNNAVVNSGQTRTKCDNGREKVSIECAPGRGLCRVYWRIDQVDVPD